MSVWSRILDEFLTMQQAAKALRERLEQVRSHADEPDRAYYTERLQYVTDLAASADPDDIFEQDSFRRLFIAELASLTPQSEG